MLRISVLHFNGAPPSAPITHDFDERGGTIGRDDSNTLALPDPDRHISRMQAQIQFDGMRYSLIDHGGNPTSINGRPLGKGSQATLRDGDELGVGDYTLRVTITRDITGFGGDTLPNVGAGTDPLGLFGSAPAATPPLQPPPLFAPAAPPAAAHSDDPFAVFAGAGAAFPPQPPSTPPSTDDPFSAFAAPPRTPRALAPDPLGIGDLARPAEASSLDALFGLSGGGLTQDPFAGSPLGDPAHTPHPAASSPADPLALFGAGPTPIAAGDVQRHDSPLLNDAFVPPLARAETPPATTPAAPEHRPSVPQAPEGGVVSWSNTSDTPPQAPPAPAAAEPTAAAPDPLREAPTLIVSAKAAAAVPPPLPAATTATSPSTATSTPGAASADALLAAFARGVGLPALTPPGGLSPALMEQIGMVLREAVQGTVELLIARAATKREVRADVTMIVSKNNNPLKFSPDVDFALMQLLLPQGKGFMGPSEAMRDAYDDLRAHQIGFMAGMRAALASVLARFTPAELEARLTSRSLLDSVLPANRKARLWDLYEQRYQDISREAEDDFHALFGREFLKAYEAQIAQLQDTQQ